MVDLWKEKSLATAGCGMWEMEATVSVLVPAQQHPWGSAWGFSRTDQWVQLGETLELLLVGNCSGDLWPRVPQDFLAGFEGLDVSVLHLLSPGQDHKTQHSPFKPFFSL